MQLLHSRMWGPQFNHARRWKVLIISIPSNGEDPHRHERMNDKMLTRACMFIVSARQETKAGPGIKAETIEKCCLLACLACSLLQLRPTCPYMTPSTLGWVPYINQQARKGLKIYQRVSPISEILSFQVCLSVYQVGKTTIFGVSTNHLCHLRTIDLN